MRYLVYARRSSDERSRRQVQSIEDQLADIHRLATDRHLNILEELTESRSAKEPGRPVFNRMIEKIRRGEAEAILCWKLDRLARNPIDAATLRWLMRQGHLQEIRTPFQTYTPQDNAVITAVESAMAEQYIIDLKKGVERGMHSKCEKGGFPGKAPHGYRNDRLNATLEVDEPRFTLLQNAWHLLIEGHHTVPELHHLLTGEWAYRPRSSANRPGKNLSLNGLYHIFRNPFYKGEFIFQGKLYRHHFPPMVTPAQWQQAQEAINRRGSKKPVRHENPFTGLIHCASCGFLVSADRAKGHTYYHCNNRLGLCSKKGIREEEIARLIERALDSIAMPPEFEAFAQRVLSELEQEERLAQRTIAQSQQEGRRHIEKKQASLLNLYLEGHLSSDEYAAHKEKLQGELKSIGRVDVESTPGWEEVRQDIGFVTTAHAAFVRGDAPTQRALARHLADVYWLNNGKELHLEIKAQWKQVRKCWKEEALPKTIHEPQKIGSGSRLKGQLPADIQVWCTRLRKYRTWLHESKVTLIESGDYSLPDSPPSHSQSSVPSSIGNSSSSS